MRNICHGSPSKSNLLGLFLDTSYLWLRSNLTAVRSISEQIQLVSYLRSNAFVGVVGKRLIQW